MSQNLTFFVSCDIIIIRSGELRSYLDAQSPIGIDNMMNSDNNNFSSLELLDIITIMSFIMQMRNIENSQKHLHTIEEKLDLIIKHLNIKD